MNKIFIPKMILIGLGAMAISDVYAALGPKGMLVTTESPNLSISYSQSTPPDSKVYAEGRNVIYFQTASDGGGHYSLTINDVKIYPDTSNQSQYCSAAKIELGGANMSYNFVGLQGNGGLNCQVSANNTPAAQLIIK